MKLKPWEIKKTKRARSPKPPRPPRPIVAPIMALLDRSPRDGAGVRKRWPEVNEMLRALAQDASKKVVVSIPEGMDARQMRWHLINTTKRYVQRGPLSGQGWKVRTRTREGVMRVFLEGGRDDR